MPYIPPSVITDVDTLYQDSIERWQNYYPEWEPDEASVLARILSVASYLSYEQANTLVQQFDNIFTVFGEDLYGIAAIDPQPATGVTTWTANDTVGHTIPAGTEVLISGVAFSTDADVVIPPGSSTTAAGAVAVTAINAGTDGNALTGSADPVTSLAWVDTVTLVGSTAGGTDGETATEYRERLADELSTVSPTAVTADDFERFARRVPGSFRAVVLDAFKPFTNLLSTNQASVETDTTGFTAGTNTTIARSTAQASHGAASLSMTRTASTGDATVRLTVPIIPSTQYTARAEFRAAATARTVRLDINWLDASGASISTTTGTGTADTTAGWTTVSTTATSPSTAWQAVIIPTSVAAIVSEVNYVDKLGFKAGTDTTWAATDTSSNVYDAPTDTWGNPGYIAVSAVDEAGNPANSADVLADLNGRRMTGIAVNWIAPTYNPINVTAAVTIDDERYVEIEVLDQVEAAINDYLDPAMWGVPSHTDADLREWKLETYVRRDELFTVMNNVAGVEHVDSLSINGNTTTNVQLVGTVPLPTAGSILLTAT